MDNHLPERLARTWFPGHIAAARFKIKRDIRLADLVIELLDSRIPLTSRAHGLTEALAGRPRLVVLNRSDQAPPDVTQLFKRQLAGPGVVRVVRCDSTAAGTGRSMRGLIAQIREELAPAWLAHRVIVIGTPNVGKSRFINALLGHRKTRVADTPGVTRGPQWVPLDDGLELMDLPGTLAPGTVDQLAALKFALCRTIPLAAVIPDDCVDLLARAARLPVNMVRRDHPFAAAVLAGEAHPLDRYAELKNFVTKGGTFDRPRAMTALFKDFGAGRIGRFMLDLLPEPGTANPA